MDERYEAARLHDAIKRHADAWYAGEEDLITMSNAVAELWDEAATLGIDDEVQRMWRETHATA